MAHRTKPTRLARASSCKTHNPYIRGNMEMLTDAMISASKDMNAQQSQPEFAVNLILADGDFVAAYTTMLNSKSKPREGDLRQVHLFHFEEERIIEYWDISQHVLPSMPNACGAF